MTNIDICYKFLHSQIDEKSEYKTLRHYKLTGKPYLIGDKRATKKVVSAYVSAVDNTGYSGGFDAFCRRNRLSDNRKAKNKDFGYRDGDTKGAHILFICFIILVIYVVVVQ